MSTSIIISIFSMDFIINFPQQIHFHPSQPSHTKTFYGKFIIKDIEKPLGRTDLDEEILSTDYLQCVIDEKNSQLGTLGYKVGTRDNF